MPDADISTDSPEGQHPAHLAAIGHKQQVRNWLLSLAVDAQAQDPDQPADELLIVLNGAYATGAVLDGAAYGRRALGMARRLSTTPAASLTPNGAPAGTTLYSTVI